MNKPKQKDLPQIITVTKIKRKEFWGVEGMETMLGKSFPAQVGLKLTISGILRLQTCTPMPCQKLYLKEPQRCPTLT